MSSRYTLIMAGIVVALCLVGTLTAFALGNLLDDDEGHPGYTVAGTGPDGRPCTGTAVCESIGESGRTSVLEFTFSVTLSDGTTDSFRCYYLTGSDDSYTEAGSRTVNGTETTVLMSVSDPEYRFCVSQDGDVLAVDRVGGGYDVTAQATP